MDNQEIIRDPQLVQWRSSNRLCVVCTQSVYGKSYKDTFGVARNATITLSGYVKLGDSDFWYGRNTDDDEIKKINVPGGITYAGFGHPVLKDNDYWLGFAITETCKCTDVGMELLDIKPNVKYETTPMLYLAKQTEKLAMLVHKKYQDQVKNKWYYDHPAFKKEMENTKYLSIWDAYEYFLKKNEDQDD